MIKETFSTSTKIFIVLIFNIFSMTIFSQNVKKTITFNSVTLSAGSCYLNGDVGGGADFAILVKCNFGDNSLLFAGDWPEGSTLSGSGTYSLGPIYSGFPGFSCPSTNMVLEPISSTITTLPFSIEAFESDDNSCEGPYDGALDDCYGGVTNVNLNITNGSHSVTLGSSTAHPITYNYTVTSSPTNSTAAICGVVYWDQIVDVMIEGNASVVEGSNNPLTYRFSLYGNATQTTTINFSIEGSASSTEFSVPISGNTINTASNVIYNNITRTGSLEIQSGNKTGDLQIIPAGSNNIVNGDKTIVVRILPYN